MVYSSACMLLDFVSILLLRMLLVCSYEILVCNLYSAAIEFIQQILKLYLFSILTLPFASLLALFISRVFSLGYWSIFILAIVKLSQFQHFCHFGFGWQKLKFLPFWYAYLGCHIYVFWDRFNLYRPGCPGIWFVGLELEIPLPLPQVLGLKVCTATTT